MAVVYLTVFWTMSGRTYGQLVMGLRVLGYGGRRLRFVKAFIRAVFVVVLPIGIVWIPFSRNNKSLQDLVLATRVVYDWEPRTAHADPAVGRRGRGRRGRQLMCSRQSSGTAPSGPGVG